MSVRTIIIRTSFNAKHRWKMAPIEVEFLRSFHDHIFNIQAEIEVKESDRELEFFLVKRYLDAFIEANFPKEFELSCEAISEIIVIALKDKYGQRYYKVSTTEDGFNGGTYSNG